MSTSRTSTAASIVLKSPFAATFLMGIASESGSIVPKAAVEKLKDQKFTTELPGQCGPYIDGRMDAEAEGRAQGQSRLEGNAKPVFGEVQFINIEDTKAAELAFEAGEVDITDVLPETAARYQEADAGRIQAIEPAGPLLHLDRHEHPA